MFEDLGKKLAVIGRQVIKKTGETAEIASLQTKVMARKKKVQSELRNLGRLYYEAHKDEMSEFETNITTINNLYREISGLEEEIRAVKERAQADDRFEEEYPFGTGDVSEETESYEDEDEEDLFEDEELFCQRNDSVTGTESPVSDFSHPDDGEECPAADTAEESVECTAEDKKSTVETAESVVETAESIAEDVKNDVEAAESIAEDVKNDVEAAESAVEIAENAVEDAKSASDDAKSSAEGAN